MSQSRQERVERAAREVVAAWKDHTAAVALGESWAVQAAIAYSTFTTGMTNLEYALNETFDSNGSVGPPPDEHHRGAAHPCSPARVT